MNKNPAKTKLGAILSGSLTEGFKMRISSFANVEEIKTGKFVSIVGDNHKFFSLITDLKLEVSNPDILLFPPGKDETLLKDILDQNGIYSVASLRPMLVMDQFGQKSAVKTIPKHFSSVYEASHEDISMIFGDENSPDKRYFNIGTPLDMNSPVCLDLDALSERSNGIFGKTGTGKTFLTRLLLAGLIKNDKAVNLVFDMHSEYGFQARKEGGNNSFVKGLKTLFPQKIVIFSLDPESTRRRGANPDEEIVLSYQSIQVEDLLSLQNELSLHTTACEAAYLIAAKYKQNWLKELLEHGDQIKEFAEKVGAHPESVSALYRKLKVVERLPFFNKNLSGRDNTIDRMIEYIDRGISIIIEFGNYTSTFCYLLIANIVTRRIHKLYRMKTEKFLGTHKKEDEPKKLMITIEEAHKFLSPTSAKQTIFGTIAREMRKYYVSLLIVDQRPSDIDDEVLSQIGTKIIAQLSDEKDINATLTGTRNASQLRSVLSSLDSKKQVLLLGHAVAMPIVIETRNYDEKFYAAMEGVVYKKVDDLIEELF